MTLESLPDQSAREKALNAEQSFIVQAPAGSGKTELLTLRYLKLLASCEQPEEVLAITFTRKAASEMRDRIIRALNWCQSLLDDNSNPQSAIEQLRFDIGKTVLKRDKSLNWHLLDNPSRFRVQTIDSFCFYLAKQLPILSQVGGDPKLLENIDHCFIEAIRNTLSYLESTAEIADDLETLARHLDNDMARVENLLIGLMRQREQWSNHLFRLNVSSRSGAEDQNENIAEWVSESLITARDALLPHQAKLIALYNHAAAYREELDNLPFSNWQKLSELPEAELEQLPQWHLLLEFLLTQDQRNPKWLRRVQAKHGFPAKTVGDNEFKVRNESLKQERIELIETLENEIQLLETLNYLRLMPSLEAEQDEWKFLGALFRVLHLLSAELYVAMQHLGVVDYTQIGSSAMLALGEEDNPTDIALALDHVIRHILVDEFQDTSYFQLILLEKLTTGWEENDGRSLFLVGDAMQSCYGFRNANVGIYLDVWEHGLRTVHLDTLRLTSNFRSQSNIVNWVNDVFSKAFPQQIDISRGAVPYSNADSLHTAIPNQGVELSLISFAPENKYLAEQAEADAVVRRTVALRENFPEDSIAILVRNRGHLSLIVRGLRESGLTWSATDIDKLNSLAVIDDMMSIVRIILNPGDRLAWIAMLRAPWCGLGIKDLHEIATYQHKDSDIWTAIQCFNSIETLSETAKLVLPSFVEIMHYLLLMRGRSSLRFVVEAAWNLLRGPFACENELDLESAQRFLSLVEEKEQAGGINDLNDFEESVESAFVPSPSISDSANLNLLTMHKAKGLEFDHVVLPSLNRGSRGDEKPLLVWHERLNSNGDNRLFMAGLTATGSSDSQLYQLLRHEQKIKNQLESTRLLYIAVTRAKKSASLFATLGKDDNGQFTAPSANALLSRIWPVLKDSNETKVLDVEDLPDYEGKNNHADEEDMKPSVLRRFTEPLELHKTEAAIMATQTTELDSDDSAEESAGLAQFELESLKGILIHRCLENYVQAQDQAEYLKNLPALHGYLQLKLRHLSISETEMENAVNSIENAVKQTVKDPELEWIFNQNLSDSSCELAVSRAGDGFIDNRIIDRSFIDDSGVRWIIDYKTGIPGKGVSNRQFIEEQKAKYESQLSTYQNIFEGLESRPVKKALLLTGIRELVELN